MYQSVNLVGHQNVSLLHIRHDESVLSPMLAFLKVSFSEFSSFVIILICHLLYLQKVLNVSF